MAFRTFRVFCAATAAAALLLVSAPPAAHAHRAPLSLAAWGGFGASAARCQRALGDAATQCALDVWALRAACIEPQLAGGLCDANATNAAVVAARQLALNRASYYCSESDVETLRFVDLSEALNDLTSVCRQLELALVSAAYGPALLADVVVPVDDQTHTCLAAGAAAAGQVLQYAVRTQRTPLDHIAAQPMLLPAKTDLVARAGAHVASAEKTLAGRAAARCPTDQFGRIYNHSLDLLISDVASRAACLIGGVYVEDALVCPPPVCGNGMQEPTEACDDGNSIDSDWCHSDCTLNDCNVYAGTYDMIQQAIFDGEGCSIDTCHGSAAAGGLDLRVNVSYGNLVGVPSVSTDQERVDPGDSEQSRLWLLLAKATLNRTDVPGRAMPLDQAPLSTNELDVLSLWIDAGAPRRGTVVGSGALLNACLPPP